MILRDLVGMPEFLAAEALQRAVWGAGDKEDPGDLMMVIQHEGGLVAGAFEEDRLLGYIFAFPTATPGVQHSHRLAVLDEARGRGIGVALKNYQRDWCLARGIDVVRWTYDPLRRANAALNIGRLGAHARSYLPDYYGKMAGINQGVASDRLLAEWHLHSPRGGMVAGEVARLATPEDFGALLARDPAQAQEVRLQSRDDFQAAFAQGLEIRGYDAARGEYLLAPRAD